MPRITIDDILVNRLLQPLQPVELCDATGNVVGSFVPDLSQFDLGEDPSEEELQRRENSSERRYTTAEVLEHLKSLS